MSDMSARDVPPRKTRPQSRALTTPMGRGNRGSTTVRLTQAAETLADAQRLSMSTAHVLAEIARTPGPASDVLLLRRLDHDTLSRGARVSVDDDRGAVERMFTKAKDFAARTGLEMEPIHVLFALCQNPKSAAARVLAQCGVDVAKLRATVMQVALGFTSPVRLAENSKTRSGGLGSAMLSSEMRASSMRTPSCAPQTVRSPRPAQLALPALPPSSPPPKLRTERTHVERTHVERTHVERTQPRAERTHSFALEAKKYPLLAKLGRNLTELAAARGLGVVVGREREVERVLDVLGKRSARFCVLVGKPGVGRRSTVNALAQHFARQAREEDARIVVALDGSALLSGAVARGSLAERLGQLVAEVKKSKGRIVLCIEDMTGLLADAGGEIGELRAWLEREHGELICIAAPEELKKWPATLTRMAHVLDVRELSHDEAVTAMTHAARELEAHHGVTIDGDVIRLAVSASVRYAPESALPEKAIRWLDQAAARARRQGARALAAETLADVASELSGVPAERLLETDHARMMRLGELLAERIVGHESAITRIARVLMHSGAGLRGKRPLGTFLLLGPTGVGKTEMAKSIARALFDSESAMTRLDLSEFAEPHSIARLVGAPPGYVGHDDGGHLTEAVRKRPYQVVLLDELEKAHRDVLEAFLQVFDEGRLTDARGHTVDFTNCVFVLTSNLGSEISPERAHRSRIGFSGETDAKAMLDAYEVAVLDAAKRALAPEFMNRIDEVIAMRPLSRADIARVARGMLDRLGRDLETQKGVRFSYDDAVVDALLENGGYDAAMGARPMRRAIARIVEAPLAELLLRRELLRGDRARAVSDGRGRVRVQTESARLVS